MKGESVMAQENTHSGKFLARAILICILGILFMFFYSGLQNDQINIIQTFSGWTNVQTQLPMTVGNFVCIILTFVYGTLFIKFGLRKTMIPIMIICAVGCVGIAAANGIARGSMIGSGQNVNGNYGLFFVALFVVRCACMILQMGGFMLVANWFIRYRGQIMGVITMGSPLFSIIGTGVMTTAISKHFNGDYRMFYVIIAILICIIALILGVGLKDTPEECGLHPDGADHAPKSEAEEETKLTVRDVLSSKIGWQLIISFGAFQFIINACMGSMAARYMSLGASAGDPSVWLTAVKFLSIGAALGIPMSYVFGILDDKIGSIKASIILGLTELIPVIGLMLQPQGGNVPLMLVWGIGVACMTGGVPTMHPCITAYCYGRREYQSANRIIMAIQLIPSAVAAMMMTMFIQAGKAQIGYIVLIVIIIIGIVTMITMKNVKDANAADRMYAKEQK
jgi:OFA family oxalate/formate antiporter-like MFS transporter